MTTQIAVRLPDDLVAYVDERVSSGEVPSRAAAVAQALERQRRLEAATRDAEIYARTKRDDDDLNDLAAWAVDQPMEID